MKNKITCMECGEEMRMITNTHLKSHGLTKEEYIPKWGVSSLACEELREIYRKRSQHTNSTRKGKSRSKEECENIQKGIIKTFENGREAHNKGKPMSESQKKKIQLKANERNARWREEDSHPLKGVTLSDSVKQKISDSVKEYCENNTQEIHIRAQKILKIKQDNGYDFGSSFRGRTHTQESKNKISNSLIEVFSDRKKETIIKKENKMRDLGYEILNHERNWFYDVKCSHCGKIFNTTIQNFNDSKIGDKCFICPSDYGKSKTELKILHDLESLLGRKLVSGDRRVLWPKEIDIFDPILQKAIEYCGLHCHGEHPKDLRFINQGKDSFYHLDKMIKCREKGIELITIFSDEYIKHPEIVMSIISQKFGLTTKRLMARKTEIREIDSKTANDFLKKNHIMGAGRSNVRYGLYHNNDLVEVMTFSKGDITHKGKSWEINRLSSKLNTSIAGGASKLFSKFIKEYSPETVISFSDLRWGRATVYEKIGFEFVYDSPPNYWYHDNVKRYHRFSLRKNKNDNQDLTEWENRKNQGWDRIWDCGHSKWIWKK